MSSREKADTADVDCHEIYSDFPVEETEEEKRILDQMTRRADGGAGLRNAHQRLLPVGHRHSGSDRSRGGRGDHVGLYRETLVSGQHGSGGWTGGNSYSEKVPERSGGKSLPYECD